MWYEPWTPAVGDRVAYRYRHECPGVVGMIAPVGHPPEFDGQSGVVYEVLLAPAVSHRFLVHLDEIGRRIQCAAIEIDPA